jgi:tRNA modification GTPase
MSGATGADVGILFGVPPGRPSDVVIATATPWGRGALAVVRLSGTGIEALLRGFVRPFSEGPIPVGRPRRVYLFDDEGVFDDAVLALGAAPKTFTGEDTAEITCHGNPLIVERLLRAGSKAGARVAEPGEFTRRALANGRIDLLGAEAILQVAEATTARGIDIARDGLDGRLTQFFEEVRTDLVACAADLEARLDYPADELAFFDDGHLLGLLGGVAERCRALSASYRAGRVMVHGARVALVGGVNAGKSSLFNALLGRDRALVHDTPGTTRDVLEIPASIAGLHVTLLDTAGERETADPVEAAGLALARDLVGEADLLVVVLRARPRGIDATERQILERTTDLPRLVVYNGVDRTDAAPPPDGALSTVARDGTGVAEVATAIRTALVGSEARSDRLWIASARQRDRLEAIADAAEEGALTLNLAGAAVAVEALYRAIAEVDATTGADARSDVLDALFARFCIGK